MSQVPTNKTPFILRQAGNQATLLQQLVEYICSPLEPKEEATPMMIETNLQTK